MLRFNSRIRKRALLPWMPKDPHGCDSARCSGEQFVLLPSPWLGANGLTGVHLWGWDALPPSRMLPPKPTAQPWLTSTPHTRKRSLVVPLVGAVYAVPFHMRIQSDRVLPTSTARTAPAKAGSRHHGITSAPASPRVNLNAGAAPRRFARTAAFLSRLRRRLYFFPEQNFWLASPHLFNSRDEISDVRDGVLDR